MLADLRDALRQLRKAPGFTATVVVTLALGIGATTAIFTPVHQVMLESLPVTKPEELWRIGDKIRCRNWGGYVQGDDGDFALFSWEAYKHFREHTPEFTDLAALQAGNAPRVCGGPDRSRRWTRATGSTCRGTLPHPGRAAVDGPSDDRGRRPRGRTASCGDELPRLGEQVRLRSFSSWREFPDQRARVYRHRGDSARVLWRETRWLGYAGYLAAHHVRAGTCHGRSAAQASQRKLSRPAGQSAPGVNLQALEAKATSSTAKLASHVADMEPGEKQLWQQQTLHLIPGGAGVAAMRDEYQEGLKLLLIAAGCVLLVACGNLANLMLARGLKSRAQISVRVALGASRCRPMRRALGGERAAGGDRRSIWNRCRVWRNATDFIFGLRDRRAE